MNNFFQRIWSQVSQTVFNNRLNLDELLYIIRPVVYVYLVYKHGRMSYYPIKVCLVLDLIAISISFRRLSAKEASVGSDGRKHRLKSVERRELARRIRDTILKYFLRDPIFEVFTKKILEKIFSTLRLSPSILDVVLNLVNYFRDYASIA